MSDARTPGRPASPLLRDLKARLREASDVSAAASLLNWDQLTHMPPGGAAARGRQLATLNRLAHRLFTDAEVGRLLDALEASADAPDPEGDPEGDPESAADAALLRVTRRDYERALRVPGDFLAELSEHLSDAYAAWLEAREADDFQRVAPLLETTVELSRRYAGFFPGHAHVADPLIDEADEGMTVAKLKTLFAELRAELVPLVDAVLACDPPAADFLQRRYPADEQLAVALEFAREFGYDTERGRLDLTTHPFAIAMAVGDVRITTRVDEHELTDGLFSTLHEAGHALYEQGVDPALDGTPLAGGASSGVHESQSRLWENLVGRSRGFWQHAFPRLRERFPEQLRGVDADAFWRAVNRVSRSLVRTESDELTYNLHVIIRFDLELALLEGELAVADLPDAWRARYESDLGVRPDTHRTGVLQDVHWFAGLVGGAFQGYTLGNIWSAQLFDAARRAHPGIPDDIGAGRFEPLHGWLRDNLYRCGRSLPPGELLRRASGRELTVAPYLAYLRGKYGEVYGLEL